MNHIEYSMIIKMTSEVTLKDDHLGEVTYYSGNLWNGNAKLVELLKMYKPEWNIGYHHDPVMDHAEYLCREISGLKIIDSKQVKQEYPDDIVF